MVTYSNEFTKKCKQIYPNESGLHDALKRKAWIAQEILGNLFIQLRSNFIDDVINYDFTPTELHHKIENLRAASKLQLESKGLVDNKGCQKL